MTTAITRKAVTRAADRCAELLAGAASTSAGDGIPGCIGRANNGGSAPSDAAVAMWDSDVAIADDDVIPDDVVIGENAG